MKWKQGEPTKFKEAPGGLSWWSDLDKVVEEGNKIFADMLVFADIINNEPQGFEIFTKNSFW